MKLTCNHCGQDFPETPDGIPLLGVTADQKLAVQTGHAMGHISMRHPEVHQKIVTLTGYMGWLAMMGQLKADEENPELQNRMLVARKEIYRVIGRRISAQTIRELLRPYSHPPENSGKGLPVVSADDAWLVASRVQSELSFADVEPTP